MPAHHDNKPHDRDDARHPEKKGPGKGPKEKEIAAALTAATITLAGASTTFESLDAAGDAVAGIYAKMFDLVAGPARK